MHLSYKTPIWLYPAPVDFRRQIDGLVMLIADQLSLQPTSGELFIFRNRQANKIKLLWYDRNGFWLCYKRLESGRLRFPKVSDEVLELSRDELSWLLSGLDFTAHAALPKVDARAFF
ncbi:MAG TPA: IS66 family insertion sequence element accessory protein TnpB, partial [Gammaproteobacteria bacterium]|nr:IS66 family insertion sequence element accessory protein TnpB [Gammaproteobacteria bacterium]